MAWQKSSPALVERFRGALPAHPELEPRQMFGYPCAFVRGNFFAGLHEQRVVMRLPGDLRAAVGMGTAAPFDPMGGRPMTDWYVVPDDTAGSDKSLGALFAKAFPLVLALPPKVKAAKKTTKKTSVTTKAAPAEKAATKRAATKKAPAKKAPAKKAPAKKA